MTWWWYDRNAVGGHPIRTPSPTRVGYWVYRCIPPIGMMCKPSKWPNASFPGIIPVSPADIPHQYLLVVKFITKSTYGTNHVAKLQFIISYPSCVWLDLSQAKRAISRDHCVSQWWQGMKVGQWKDRYFWISQNDTYNIIYIYVYTYACFICSHSLLEGLKKGKSFHMFAYNIT